MSDIVARLRDWRNLHLALGGELFEAAADEIERLRNCLSGYTDGISAGGELNQSYVQVNEARVNSNTIRLTDANGAVIHAYAADEIHEGNSVRPVMRHFEIIHFSSWNA